MSDTTATEADLTAYVLREREWAAKQAKISSARDAVVKAAVAWVKDGKPAQTIVETVYAYLEAKES